jgi:hypothetical protein
MKKNIFDKIGNWIEESYLNTNYMSVNQAGIYQQLRSWTAVDTPVNNSVGSGGSPLAQLGDQAEWTLQQRNEAFNRVDIIKNNHIAETVKKVIINNGFNDLSGGYAMTIKYRDDNDKETEELYTKDIQSFLRKTGLIDILKDCVSNEGLDYCELFLHTPIKYGHGVEYVSDDMNIRNNLALYKNTKLIGALHFDLSEKGRIGKKSFIKADDISHFMLNYEKIPIYITQNFNKICSIPEKIRCAKPLLLPVVDLIIQYNALEQLRTSLELLKATQPLLLGLGVSPDQDLTEISKQLQNLSVSLNENRNNVINNLTSLDITSLLATMQQIKLIPHTKETGANQLDQIRVQYPDDKITDILNDLRKNIAMAIPIPEHTLASASYSNVKDSKEENLLTDPGFSTMLSQIQQLLSKGIIDLIYKHLSAKYSNPEGISTRAVDREKIEVLFDSTTNLNGRLEDEDMLLKAETVGSLVNVIDSITSSPDLPLRAKAQNLLELWKKQMAKQPFVRDVFEVIPESERVQNTEEEQPDDTSSDSELTNPKETIEKEDTAGEEKDNKDDDIRDILR